MFVTIGKKYLFMGQRYCFTGTVAAQCPTHVTLGDDAQVHYEDVGAFEAWSKNGAHKKGGAVPGQIVCLLGCDVTPIGVK